MPQPTTSPTETTPPESQAVPAWKRGLDVSCILLVAPIWLAVMGVVAVLIKLVSRGPVFFIQERVGQGGRRFRCYKFRSMLVTSDQRLHRQHMEQLIGAAVPMTKLDLRGDARLIPGGWFLRATGLDELPQLINVLRGEMSLVGPRPCVPFEYDRYLPWQKERFKSLPGLTGLWQVSGKNHTTFLQMVNFDIAYCRKQSLWLDCIILLKTLPAVISQTRETASTYLPKSKPASFPQREVALAVVMERNSKH